MNASLGLGSGPSRSLLHLGLRLTCRSTSSPASSALRYLSTRTSPPCIPRVSPWSTTTIRRDLWPSPAATQRRWAAKEAFPKKNPPKNTAVLRDYVDLPLEYKDKLGLPFRAKDLSASEVTTLFGSGISTASANKLLRIMHGRRVAGTLQDPAFSINTAAYTQDQLDAALKFLRETVPVDEILNAGLRAEDELVQLEKEFAEAADAEKTPSLRNDTPDDFKPDPIYGYSVMDAVRAKNQAKAAEEEKRLAREAMEKGLEAPGAVAGPVIKRPPMSPAMQKYTDAAISDLKEPPPLTVADRLLPSTAIVLLLIGALSSFAILYVPPRTAERMFPEISASQATVGALVALNALVFVAWRVPPLWPHLNRYFILVHGMPRAATMLTANFSHMSFWHLASNMGGLWFIGTALHDEIGRANFLAVYLASGAVGLLSSLTYFTLRGMTMVTTLGASGAVFGVTTAYFWMHRFDSFKVLGLPPDPADGAPGLAFIGLILGLHVFALLRKGKQTIDLTSHLFGMLTGAVGIELMVGGDGGKRSRGTPAKDVVKDALPVEGAEDVKA